MIQGDSDIGFQGIAPSRYLGPTILNAVSCDQTPQNDFYCIEPYFKIIANPLDHSITNKMINKVRSFSAVLC